MLQKQSVGALALCATRVTAVFALALAFIFVTSQSSWADDTLEKAITHTLMLTSDEKLGSLVFGLLVGVIMTAAVYLFFIWIVMRDRGQVSLILLLVSLTINMVSSNPMLMDLFGITGTAPREMLADYSLVFSCIFGAVFTYYFLEVDINVPIFKYVIIVLCASMGLLLIYSIFDTHMMQYAMPTLAAVAIGVILEVGALSFYHRIPGSLTHIFAFLCFLTGIVARPIYDVGLLHSAIAQGNLTYLSFAMAALMFAVVTSSQFAARQEEKERALARSNERFTLATRGANEGLFDWNIRTGEVFFSEQLKKILGLRLENKTDDLKTWIRLICDTDRRVVREALRRFRQNLRVSTLNIEYRVSVSPEEKRWLHTKIIAVRGSTSRKITRLVGSTSDITARKSSENALRASEMRFRSITEAHPVPVMIVGLRSGEILYASPSAEQLLGLSQNEILHHSFNRFLQNDDMRIEIWESMSRGREINLKEVRLTTGDGHLRDAALSARRISYQNEEAMVLGLYDLTERKQAEVQIAQQQEALQQSEKMAALGGLLAGVAHELNNPLSVVVGQATLLMEGQTEPKVVARADKIYKAADRCARIVKSFLALARRKPPERKPMELNAIISGALELLGYQIRTGNIDVQLQLATDLSEVAGDADQMTQVITNLVLNATQALQSWQGKRVITIHTENMADDMVRLSVADTGPGVPPDIRARIFEPFFTTKGGTGGTGVGLSLCLNIVASHGGQLTVEDTLGGGATFQIVLPKVQQSTGAVAEDAPDHVTLSKKLRILLVDDEIELAQTLADLLEPDGCEVDIAINGAVALDKLHKNPFDVIVSDLRMPVLDGPGLYEALGRELPSYQHKIIYVTGDTLSTNVQAFLKQYPVPVIEKPYRLSDVRRAIDDLIKADHVAS